MPRYTKRPDIRDYLDMFPAVEERWINHCIACDAIGYRPDMPDEAKGAWKVKRDLRPMSLSDIGLCEACARIASRAR